MAASTVSALVVTYDHGRYVAEALRSALSQTVPPDEVILVDDGSEDDTLEQARSVADPRIRIIALPHRGIDALAETYNAGIAACRGDLVAILEGDDRWPPRKLELQTPVFGDRALVLSHGRYAVIGAQGRVLHPGVGPSIAIPDGTYDPRPYILRASYIMPVTAVMRREALRACGFRQAGVHGDYATFLALAELGQFHFQRAVLGEWRRHSASVVHRLAGLDLEGFDLSISLALAARARAQADASLPSPAEIVRSWSDAYARMVWQAARIYLLNARYGEARRFLVPALRRPCSPALRARLLLATAAAFLRVNVEPLARLITGRSVFAELD